MVRTHDTPLTGDEGLAWGIAGLVHILAPVARAVAILTAIISHLSLYCVFAWDE